jgi:hypothetical protein
MMGQGSYSQRGRKPVYRGAPRPTSGDPPESAHEPAAPEPSGLGTSSVRVSRPASHRGVRPVSSQTQGSIGFGSAATPGRATDSAVEQGLEVDGTHQANPERARKRGSKGGVRCEPNGERARGRGDVTMLLAREKLRRVVRHREWWKCWERISASAMAGRTCPSRQSRSAEPIEEAGFNVATRGSRWERSVWGTRPGRLARKSRQGGQWPQKEGSAAGDRGGESLMHPRRATTQTLETWRTPCSAAG